MSGEHAVPTRITSLSSGSRPQLKRKRSTTEPERVYENAQTAVLKSRDGFTVRKCTPICLLPRGQLPLAWLDPSDNGIQYLTGEMPMLDVKSRGEAVVIVAEDVNTKRLVAIERAGSQAYALCRISVSVEPRALRARAIIRYNLAQPEHTCALSQPVRKKQHMLTPPPHASSPAMANPAEKVLVKQNLLEIEMPTIALIADPSTDPAQPEAVISTEDMLKELTKQYLDALYLSRTSVAYFAKGPLSKVRHATATAVPELASYLREMLLSTSTTDKRQRDTLPALINEFARPAGDSSKDNKKPRKAKWKAKRDKAGLLHEERQYLQQWWQHTQEDEAIDHVGVDMSMHTNKRLQSLRKRETFLQVVLLLETMITEEATAGIQDTSLEKKPRKELDLQMLLEALLDKLTIWHSVDFKSPEKKTKADDDTPETSDELRSFCTEVVIPFYMSKLAKTASFVNKRLGGPSTHTPSRRKTSSRKPGEPTKRPTSNKRPRPGMSRTTTNSSLPTLLTPSLERSATEPQLTGKTRIKREQSLSISLSQIPAIRPAQLSQALASLSRREIDLTAVSTATESRLRRKAEQEAKIKEAVASIRRPDRALALKENAALVDATFAKSLVDSKKGQPSGIHIAATPHAAKYIAATPRKQGDTVAVPGYTAYLAPPQLLAVPQTGHRDRIVNHAMATPAIIEDEGQTSYAFPTDLGETPVLHRTKIIDVTPIRSRTTALLETPLAKTQSITFQARLVPPLANTSTNIMTTPSNDKSIYNVLGWDNDDYEALA